LSAPAGRPYEAGLSSDGSTARMPAEGFASRTSSRDQFPAEAWLRRPDTPDREARYRQMGMSEHELKAAQAAARALVPSSSEPSDSSSVDRSGSTGDV